MWFLFLINDNRKLLRFTAEFSFSVAWKLTCIGGLGISAYGWIFNIIRLGIKNYTYICGNNIYYAMPTI